MMEEEAGIKEISDVNDEKSSKEEIFTKVVRAGKRTYFFDVKATRKEDYYLTITESKKRMGKDGKAFYEKHKIFLYKEDFDKFIDGLKIAIDYIGNGQTELKSTHVLKEPEEEQQEEQVISSTDFTNIEFDDLGKK
jgi:hypothetical protein